MKPVPDVHHPGDSWCHHHMCIHLSFHGGVFLAQLPYWHKIVKRDLTETTEEPQSDRKSHVFLSRLGEEATRPLHLHRLKQQQKKTQKSRSTLQGDDGHRHHGNSQTATEESERQQISFFSGGSHRPALSGS